MSVIKKSLDLCIVTDKCDTAVDRQVPPVATLMLALLSHRSVQPALHIAREWRPAKREQELAKKKHHPENEARKRKQALADVVWQFFEVYPRMAFTGMAICRLCEHSGSYTSCEIQYKDGSPINLRDKLSSSARISQCLQIIYGKPKFELVNVFSSVKRGVRHDQ